MTAFARDAAVVILGWLVVGAVPGSGEEPSKKDEAPRVTATGTASALLSPDGAWITFAVTTTEVTGKSVRELNEKQVKKVKDALAALGLKKSAVEVRVTPSSISSLLAGKDNAPGGRTIQGKRLRTIFHVTVREKDSVKLRDTVTKLVEAAVDNGGRAAEPEDPLQARFRRIRGGDEESSAGPTIEWLAEENGAARRAAIRRAMTDALDDAQAVAGNAKLKVLSVTVSAARDQQRRLRLGDLSGEAQASLIRLHVEVNVTCSY